LIDVVEIIMRGKTTLGSHQYIPLQDVE